MPPKLYTLAVVLSMLAAGVQAAPIPDNPPTSAEWDRILGNFQGPWHYRSPRVPGGELLYQAELIFSRDPSRTNVIHRKMLLRSSLQNVTTDADLVYNDDGTFAAYRDGFLIAEGRCSFTKWQVVCLDSYQKKTNERGIAAGGGQTLVFTGAEYDMAGEGKEESCIGPANCTTNGYFYRASLTRR